MPTGSKGVKFTIAWCAVLLAKLWLAAALQPFGDEAFYAWEAAHPAWAYSDLPGLTAWLAWCGLQLPGEPVFAMRLPFVLLGSLLPWLVWRIARRWFGDAAGWQAAWLALLMPLSGLMGVLALPDVPMLVAALLCLDAIAMLLRQVSPFALAWLALGLVLGAFSHYRFALVVAAGLAGLLCAPQGRALLRAPALWAVLAIGALAWWPVLAWNLSHAGAGLGFQFVDRHPWTFQPEGLWWPLVQALLVTPLLFLLLCLSLREAWRRRRGAQARWPLMLGLAGVAVPGYFLLGFVADAERVSFHWPLPGWLALCCIAPPVLARWRPAWRLALHASAALGTGLLLAYLVALALPAGRAALAAGPAYADNLSGWDEVAAAVRGDLAGLPPGTRLVADNFMLAAQLRLALGRHDVDVLPHPLNGKHGRARQLQAWGVLDPRALEAGGSPVLLVVEDTARPLRQRREAYDALCTRAGALPAPRVLNVDHGRKRFLRFVLAADRGPARGGCVLPALAWLDHPAPGAALAPGSPVEGWALKPGAGLAKVQLLLDGEPVATFVPDLARPDVLGYWGLQGRSDERVGFRLPMPAVAHPAGRAWLGLRLYGTDGSVEDWPAQPVDWRPSGQHEAGAP